jgi:hypothetical protein
MASYKGNPKTTVKARFTGGKFWNADEDTGKFNALLILEPGQEEKVRAIRDEALKAKFGAKVPKNLQDWSLREGDDEEFENSFERFYINPIARKKAPKAFTKKGNVLTEIKESDNILYAGCFVYAVVDCFAYPGDKTKKIQPGVTMSLQSMVFWKGGDAIGYDGMPSSNDYDDMESEEEEVEDDDDDLC